MPRAADDVHEGIRKTCRLPPLVATFPVFSTASSRANRGGFAPRRTPRDHASVSVPRRRYRPCAGRARSAGLDAPGAETMRPRRPRARSLESPPRASGCRISGLPQSARAAYRTQPPATPARGSLSRLGHPWWERRPGEIPLLFRNLRDTGSAHPAKPARTPTFDAPAGWNFPRPAHQSPRNRGRFSRHPRVSGDKIPRGIGDKTLSGQPGPGLLRQRGSGAGISAEPTSSGAYRSHR